MKKLSIIVLLLNITVSLTTFSKDHAKHFANGFSYFATPVSPLFSVRLLNYLKSFSIKWSHIGETGPREAKR